MTRHFDRITEQIMAMIADGAENYAMPWHALGRDIPVNATTGKAYRGLNVLSLWMEAASQAYPTGRWASYRQWAAGGAQVRKGEKGTPIFFWQARDTVPGDENAASERRLRGFVARTYVVFNEAQVDGFEAARQETETALAHDCEAIAFFEAIGAAAQHGGDHAYYRPGTDTIFLPEPHQFSNHEAYVSVRAHETVHWTGATQRLARDLGSRFGTNAYAMEELIAELGAAFLCSHLGISAAPRSNHAAYISAWLKVMKGDNKAILTAASQAQASLDWMVSKYHENTR